MSGVLNFCKCVNLVKGELLEFRAEPKFLYLNDFDCDSLVSFFVVGFIYFSKLTCSNNGLKYVVFYFLTHFIMS